MVFASTITTPITATAASPLETPLKVSKGLVYFTRVYFPPGSAGRLHLQIFDGAYQLLPASVGEDFAGNNVVFKDDDIYVKESAPFEFQIRTWNLDDTYAHIAYVHIGFVTKEVFKVRFLPTMQYDIFKKVIDELVEKQQEMQTLQKGWGFSGLGKKRE